MEIQGPMYLVSDGSSGDPVTFETEFSMNPLYYCQIPNEENLLVCGKWWIGEKPSTLTTIGSAIPKSCQVAVKAWTRLATESSPWMLRCHSSRARPAAWSR